MDNYVMKVKDSSDNIYTLKDEDILIKNYTNFNRKWDGSFKDLNGNLNPLAPETIFWEDEEEGLTYGIYKIFDTLPSELEKKEEETTEDYYKRMFDTLAEYDWNYRQAYGAKEEGAEEFTWEILSESHKVTYTDLWKNFFLQIMDAGYEEQMSDIELEETVAAYYLEIRENFKFIQMESAYIGPIECPEAILSLVIMPEDGTFQGIELKKGWYIASMAMRQIYNDEAIDLYVSISWMGDASNVNEKAVAPEIRKSIKALEWNARQIKKTVDLALIVKVDLTKGLNKPTFHLFYANDADKYTFEEEEGEVFSTEVGHIQLLKLLKAGYNLRITKYGNVAGYEDQWEFTLISANVNLVFNIRETKNNYQLIDFNAYIDVYETNNISILSLKIPATYGRRLMTSNYDPSYVTESYHERAWFNTNSGSYWACLPVEGEYKWVRSAAPVILNTEFDLSQSNIPIVFEKKESSSKTQYSPSAYELINIYNDNKLLYLNNDLIISRQLGTNYENIVEDYLSLDQEGFPSEKSIKAGNLRVLDNGNGTYSLYQAQRTMMKSTPYTTTADWKKLTNTSEIFYYRDVQFSFKDTGILLNNVIKINSSSERPTTEGQVYFYADSSRLYIIKNGVETRIEKMIHKYRSYNLQYYSVEYIPNNYRIKLNTLTLFYDEPSNYAVLDYTDHKDNYSLGTITSQTIFDAKNTNALTEPGKYVQTCTVNSAGTKIYDWEPFSEALKAST